jgi:hypothetical protein
MYISKIFFVLVMAFFVLTIGSCSKEEQCYDGEIEASHSGWCFDNCSGVCGCNGKTYCNECYAERKGIRVVSDKPCQ